MFLSLKNEAQLFYDCQDTPICHFGFISAGQFLPNITVTAVYPVVLSPTRSGVLFCLLVARCAVKSDCNKNHCVSYIWSE